MNSLYTLPLHGVICMPFCASNKDNYLHKIEVSFSTVDLNKSLTPIWTLVDNGERYSSEVTLFKEPLGTKGLDKTLNKSEPSPINLDNFQFKLKIKCQGNGIFKITKNSIVIDWQATGTDSAHYFQTLATALYLELNHVLCLHANTLAYQNQAIALVAPSRTGKTTLTAALCQQDFALMTDDMMALHQEGQNYIVYPSWPVARLWPDPINEISNIDNSHYEKVHDSFNKRIVRIDQDAKFNFCSQAKPLKVIYLLNRLPETGQCNHKEAIKTDCEIVPITTAKAIIILLQNSILGSCYRQLELESTRLIALSTLLSKVTFKQINYTSGKENLKTVAEVIKNDLKTN